MKAQYSVSFLRNSPLLFTTLMLCTLTLSCEKEYPEPIFTSSVIQGRINLGYSSDGTAENFLVAAQGPYREKTTLTDSNGNFQIDELGNGTYMLEISKQGYGTKYEYGIQLFGNDTVRVFVDDVQERVTNTLPRLLTVETRNTSYTWLKENSIAIATNKTSGEVPARVFMAYDKDVSFTHYQWTGLAQTLYRNGFDHMMFLIENVPFESGKKIYLIVYICNTYEIGYLDLYTGIWTYSTLEADKHSQVMDFIMP
jgi:hypothetical protein